MGSMSSPGAGSSLSDRGYKSLKLIGRGSQGTVTLVKSDKLHRKLVIKAINFPENESKDSKAALQECRLLEELKHPNIVEYVESFFASDVLPGSPTCLHIVMHYCDAGDLASHISQQIKDGKGDPFPESQVLDWFVQLVLAVEWIHDHKILHRDLKTKNIFLTSKGILKLGDFGIARQLSSTCENAQTVIGTPHIMSPEVFQNLPYSYESDVWACGCVLYELCALAPAFKGRSVVHIASLVVNEVSPRLPECYSSELQALGDALLLKDPSKRPSIHNVVRYPALKKHMQALAVKAEAKKCTEKEAPVIGSIGKDTVKHRAKNRTSPKTPGSPRQRVARGTCLGVPRRSESSPLQSFHSNSNPRSENSPLRAFHSNSNPRSESSPLRAFHSNPNPYSSSAIAQASYERESRNQTDSALEAKSESKEDNSLVDMDPTLTTLRLRRNEWKDMSIGNSVKSVSVETRKGESEPSVLSESKSRPYRTSESDEEKYSDDWDSDFSRDTRASIRSSMKTPREMNRCLMEHARDMEDVIGRFRRISQDTPNSYSESFESDCSDSFFQETTAEEDGGSTRASNVIPKANLNADSNSRERLISKLGDQFETIYAYLKDLRDRKHPVRRGEVLAAVGNDKRKLSLAFEVDRLVHLEGANELNAKVA